MRRRLMTRLLVSTVLSLALVPVSVAAAADGDGEASPTPGPTLSQRAAAVGECTNTGAFCAIDRTYTVDYSVTGGLSCTFIANIHWGDGRSESVTFGTTGFRRTHTYEKAGMFSVDVTGSGSSSTPGATCTFIPFSAQVEVPADRIKIELKSWIPQASVVDPVHFVSLPFSTPDLVEACSDEIPGPSSPTGPGGATRVHVHR